MLKVNPVKQTEGMCGPYCLAMILSYFNKEVEVQHLIKISKATVKKGTSAKNLMNAAKMLGFKAITKENSSFSEIEKYLSKNIPVIVNWFSEDDGHYSVVVKIDKEHIYLQDPEICDMKKMPLQTFKRVWFDFTGSYIKNKNDLRIRKIIVIFPVKQKP